MFYVLTNSFLKICISFIFIVNVMETNKMKKLLELNNWVSRKSLKLFKACVFLTLVHIVPYETAAKQRQRN
jgi:hypothetical protein